MLSKIDPNRDMREDSVILKDGNEIDIAWDWEDDDIDPRNDFELRVFKIRFDEEPWQEIEGEQKQIEFFQEKIRDDFQKDLIAEACEQKQWFDTAL